MARANYLRDARREAFVSSVDSWARGEVTTPWYKPDHVRPRTYLLKISRRFNGGIIVQGERDGFVQIVRPPGQAFLMKKDGKVGYIKEWTTDRLHVDDLMETNPSNRGEETQLVRCVPDEDLLELYLEQFDLSLSEPERNEYHNVDSWVRHLLRLE